MSHKGERIFRINMIKNSVEAAMKAGLVVVEDKLVSECCLNFGAGRRYVLEYLKDLENTGFIVRKDGKVWTPEALRVEEIINHIDVVKEKINEEVKQ